MKSVSDVRKRARTAFERNWREWAAGWLCGNARQVDLSVNLQPPRESQLDDASRISEARAWVDGWRDCPLPGVEWQLRSWARLGNQNIPVRVHLEGAAEIALWADRLELWSTALDRLGDIRARMAGPWLSSLAFERQARGWPGAFGADQAGLPSGAHLPNAAGGDGSPSPSEGGPALGIADVVRLDLRVWCDMACDDWETTLAVWDWLFENAPQSCYVRQLPIRGIDTKWMEGHDRAVKGLYRAVTGGDLAFREPEKQFRCRACAPSARLGGCAEFALSASQLAALEVPPRHVVICENLVNVLCLDGLPDTLAIHGSGYAVGDLRCVPWLADVPIVYWGDLDSNGFAILNVLRSFAPHARSVMMDALTLDRYFDLCVEEPKAASGEFGLLTVSEREALDALRLGDPVRGIANLRLEQERIEWEWANAQVKAAVSQSERR